jgi:hypothetical protein
VQEMNKMETANYVVALTAILKSEEVPRLTRDEYAIIQNEIKSELANLLEKIGREPSKYYKPGKDTTTWK